MRHLLCVLLCFSLFACPPLPPVEKDGYIMVEAESYQRQTKDQERRWVRMGSTALEAEYADPDGSHHTTASGGAYLETLPDTRVTHDDELIPGTNFSNEPGKIAILDYPIRFTTPGRYYVWVRAYSTGSEDNGIHVGLNGEWPASGQRLQWCEGKNAWTWESKQRTKEVHCGEARLIYLDIPKKGTHTISFSMREDGFEFDAFVLEQAYEKPGERP